MSLTETTLIGTFLLIGLTLLIRSAGVAWRSGFVARSAEGYRRLHRKASTALVGRGILRFPGVSLVDSTRPWILGETLFVVAAVASVSAGLSPGRAISALTAGALAGAAAVGLSFREQARKEIEAVRAALPMATFLLSLLLEAGMGSQAALRDVTESVPPGALARELDGISRSRTIGLPRAEAIDRSRRRVPLDDYRSFLNLVEQGERLGVGLSRALRELSVKMLEAQGHRAETLAQQAAVKLLFPLVAFIFPAVFLVILSPVILALFDSLAH